MTIQVETINLDGAIAPDAQGSFRCKFVVVRTPDSLVLIYGPINLFPYHADLLSAFCRARGIRYEWVKRPDVLRMLDESIGVKGGGYMDIEPARRNARFWGSSKAYGWFESDDIHLITSRAQDFSAYSIQIDT